MNIFNASKAVKIEMTKNERMMAVIKYLENLDENETKAVLGSLPKEGFLQNDIVDYFFENLGIFFNVVANAEKSGFGIIFF